MDNKLLEDYIAEVNAKSLIQNKICNGYDTKGIRVFYNPAEEISQICDFEDCDTGDWNEHSIRVYLETNYFRKILEKLKMKNVVSIECIGGIIYRGQIRYNEKLEHSLGIAGVLETKTWRENSVSCMNIGTAEKMIVEYIQNNQRYDVRVLI